MRTHGGDSTTGGGADLEEELVTEQPDATPEAENEQAGSGFAEEFPFKQLSTDEIRAAADLTNNFHCEEPTALATVMFEATNACYSIRVQPRVMPRWSDWAPAAPSRVLQAMTLQPRHGPFIVDLLESFKMPELDVSAEELWSLICYWFALAIPQQQRRCARRQLLQLRAVLFLHDASFCIFFF